MKPPTSVPDRRKLSLLLVLTVVVLGGLHWLFQGSRSDELNLPQMEGTKKRDRGSQIPERG